MPTEWKKKKKLLHIIQIALIKSSKVIFKFSHFHFTKKNSASNHMIHCVN